MDEITKIVLLIALSTAIMSVILGFVALLSQKIYIDSKTQVPTEVKVPIVGKMKTNYPSLVFVLLGFSLIFYVVQQVQSLTMLELQQVQSLTMLEQQKEPITWTIEGRFITKDTSGDFVWKDDNLKVIPHALDVSFQSEPAGRFEVEIYIDKDKTFEDIVEVIQYTDDAGTATIYPKKEFEKYENNQSSLLKHVGDRIRQYKHVQLEQMGE